MSAGLLLFFFGLAWSADEYNCQGVLSKTQSRNDHSWEWEYTTDSSNFTGRMLLHTEYDSFTLRGYEDSACVEETGCSIDGLACALRELLPIASEAGISIGRIQIDSYAVYLLARPGYSPANESECDELYSLYYERVLVGWTELLSKASASYRPVSIHSRDIKLPKPIALGDACFPDVGEPLTPWNVLDFFPVITVELMGG